MPKLQTFRQYHYDATAKVSENTRTLALAAIAVVWLFKTEKNGAYHIPESLLLPLALVIVALALDFFQHVFRSISWQVAYLHQEKRLNNSEITEETEVYAPDYINLVSYVLFYGKVIVLVAAYHKLLLYFWGSVKWVS